MRTLRGMAAAAEKLKSSNSVPHAAEFLEELTRAFGGTQGLARHFLATYLSATPGGQTRQKMLAQFITLAEKVSDQGKSQVPMEHLTDEDIERELRRRLRRDSIPGSFDPPPALPDAHQPT